MNKKDFYDRCADILGCQHDYSTFNDKIYRFDEEGKPCGTNATRWGGRHPGNGRFPGYGTIRAFGPVIHVALTRPKSVAQTFNSQEEVLAFLEGLKKVDESEISS